MADSSETIASPLTPVALPSTEATIIRSIRAKGALSRAELQDTLGASRAHVTSSVNNLIEQGILKSAGLGESQGGRPPLTYEIDGGFGYVAGLDIGATSIDLALADFNGAILERCEEAADVRDGAEVVLGRACELLHDMLKTRGADDSAVVGIGIGVPGPVKFAEGVLIAPPLMPTWESYPIKEFLRRHFPAAQVVVDNDVNVMAVGELYAGAGKGLDNFIFLKIGTGIGAGVIVHGGIYRGSDGAAGDVGHICIDYNGPICHCGNAGCVEVMAAGPAIAIRGREAAAAGESPFLAERLSSQDTLTAQDVGDAAKAGDRAANEIVQVSGRMIGGMLASLVNFFNPEVIFIGGGVSGIGFRLLAAIRQSVLRRSTALSTRRLRIEFSSLGADAGVTGAIWLALQHVFVITD